MTETLTSPPYVAAYRFTGQLSGEDYDACIADLEARLAQFPRIAVLSDLSDMQGVSLEAIGRSGRTCAMRHRSWASSVGSRARRSSPTSGGW